MNQLFFYLLLIVNLFQLNLCNKNIAYNIPDPGNTFYSLTFSRRDCLDCTGVFNLCTDADKERLGRQAIKAIHEQMDDDKDGLVEASETRDVQNPSSSLHLMICFSRSLFMKN